MNLTDAIGLTIAAQEKSVRQALPDNMELLFEKIKQAANNGKFELRCNINYGAQVDKLRELGFKVLLADFNYRGRCDCRDKISWEPEK